MKIWLLKTGEPLPVIDESDKLLRMGMLAEVLSNNNHEITWFASTFNHFKKKQCSDKDEVVKVKDNYYLNLIHAISYKKNISVTRIINHQMLAFKLKYKIKKMEKPDIIYASFPTIEFAYEAVKYGKKNNVPVVVDIRDLWPDIFKHNLKGILRYLSIPYVKYLDIKAKKVLRNCYAITSISDLMLDWGLEKGSRKKTSLDKSFYIGFKRNNDMISDKVIVPEVDKKKFNICFFATINNQFNYNIIAELAKLLEKDGVDILVCGSGPNLKTFEDLAEGSTNIKFLGWQDKDHLAYVINNSKLGLAPYKNTFDFQMSVSNKFSEYLSYKKPVLLTSTGYMKVLTDKYKVGYASDNVNDIYNFILKIKNDKKMCEEYSKNAFKLYEEKFDANRIYEELANHLEKVERKYHK